MWVRFCACLLGPDGDWMERNGGIGKLIGRSRECGGGEQVTFVLSSCKNALEVLGMGVGVGAGVGRGRR